MGEAPRQVLVVEDNRFLQIFYRTALRRAGFEITFASTGSEALPKARECRPSLVILDLMLPNVTGGEVLRQLKASSELQAVPVIIVSSLKPASLEKLGVAGYIPKDQLTEESLLAAIAAATLAPKVAEANAAPTDPQAG